MEAVKALTSAGRIMIYFCSIRSVMSALNWARTIGLAPATAGRLVLRSSLMEGAVEAVLCSMIIYRPFYFFKCSLSELRVVYNTRPHGQKPIRRWVAQLCNDRARGNGSRRHMRIFEFCSSFNSRVLPQDFLYASNNYGDMRSILDSENKAVNAKESGYKGPTHKKNPRENAERSNYIVA